MFARSCAPDCHSRPGRTTEDEKERFSQHPNSFATYSGWNTSARCLTGGRLQMGAANRRRKRKARPVHPAVYLYSWVTQRNLNKANLLGESSYVEAPELKFPSGIGWGGGGVALIENSNKNESFSSFNRKGYALCHRPLLSPRIAI